MEPISGRSHLDEVIISLGCDCHPAYLLKRLDLHRVSMPFDWLSTDAIHGIKYVYDNIRTDFSYFLRDLKKDKDGLVYSAFYECSRFFHHEDILYNKKTYDAFERRARRFMSYLERSDCLFLYNVTSYAMDSQESVMTFYNSLIEFKRVLKSKDRLLVYIRYDESTEENAKYCMLLAELTAQLDNIRMAHYVRHTNQYGIWGDETAYYSLLRDLDVYKL